MKKLFPVLLISVFALGGCNKTIDEVLETLRGNRENGQEENGEIKALKISSELKLYNDFLGLSYRVPKNWWVSGVNEANFSRTKGDITGAVSMDISDVEYNKYEYSYIDLVSFANLEKSTMDNHLGFDLDVRSLKGTSGIASFMKYYEEFMLEPTEEADYKLLESEQTTIAGKTFEIRIYLLDRGNDNYHILTATCPVKEGYFFNVEASYWPGNARAKQAIIDHLKASVEFY